MGMEREKLYSISVKTQSANGTDYDGGVYLESEVAPMREHYRSLAPRGATQTIRVDELNR
jgi:hypothetical protein